jgi:hypothetical protein
MKLLAVLPLLLVMMAFATHAIAAAAACRRSHAVTGKCTLVRGSLGLTDGLGVTLMTEDGRRILIKAPPDSNADISPTVMRRWLYWKVRTHNMDARVKGRFQICPLPPVPNPAGISAVACINSGTHVVVDKTTSAIN